MIRGPEMYEYGSIYFSYYQKSVIFYFWQFDFQTYINDEFLGH